MSETNISVLLCSFRARVWVYIFLSFSVYIIVVIDTRQSNMDYISVSKNLNLLCLKNKMQVLLKICVVQFKGRTDGIRGFLKWYAL